MSRTNYQKELDKIINRIGTECPEDKNLIYCSIAAVLPAAAMCWNI